MATYKYSYYIDLSNSEEFDKTHNPGDTTPNSGIYCCEGCGREIVSERNQSFPPQNHHQHSYQQGSIRWRLAVYADHHPK
jgi:hypothetical protein